MKISLGLNCAVLLLLWLFGDTLALAQGDADNEQRLLSRRKKKDIVTKGKGGMMGMMGSSSSSSGGMMGMSKGKGSSSEGK